MKPIILTWFEQPSTRTKLSFQIAGSQLGYTMLDFPELSSIEKGESLKDTIDPIKALGVNVIIYRGNRDVAPYCKDLTYINAGTDTHPTQAMIDLKTIQQHFNNKIDDKMVLFVGLANRVWESNYQLFGNNGLGFHYAFPGHTHSLKNYLNLAATKYDIIYMLRPQEEQYPYHNWTLTEELMNKYPYMHVMSAGPCTNEIEPSVVYHPRSLIQAQVRNSVPVRMEILKQAVENGVSCL